MIDIKHIKLVKEIVDEGSLSKASKVLNLTTSALSHQLRELEDYLNMKLFTRDNNNRLTLTEDGLMFYNYSLEINDSINRLIGKIKSVESGNGYLSLTIGIDTYTTYSWFPKLKVELSKSKPNIKLSLYTNYHHNTIELLESGKVDFALSGFMENKSDLSSHFLFRDELVVCVPKNIPTYETVNVEQLGTIPLELLTHCTRSELSRIFEGASSYKLPKSISFSTFDNTELILNFIDQGLGYSILSKWAILPYLKYFNNIKLLSFPDPLVKNWYLIYQKECRNNGKGEALTSIVDIMRERVLDY